MTAKEKLVIELIRKEPTISQENLAKMANMSRAAVSVHISNLMKKGYILGRGYILDDTPFVLVLGASSLDTIGKYDQRDGVHLEKRGIVSVAPGGVANNIATTLIKMGCDTSFVSAFGNDLFAPVLKQMMQETGFKLDHCYDDPDYPTSAFVCLLDENLEKEAAIASYELFDNFKMQHLQENKTLFSSASILVTDCNIPTEAHEFALNACPNPAYLDAVSVEKAMRAKPLLGRFDTVKVNKDQAEALSGLSIEGDSGLRKVADGLLATGVRRIIITMGREGIFIKSRDSEYNLEIESPENVVNYVGSGDVFYAGLIHGEFNGLSEEDSIKLGLYVSSLSLASISATPNVIKASKIKQMVKDFKETVNSKSS